MDYVLSDEEGGIVPKVLRDGLVFKDEDGQVIFNQYSFCELVKAPAGGAGGDLL